MVTNTQEATEVQSGQVAPPSSIAVFEEDPITGLKWKPGNWQEFSWPWVWLSIGSFVLAQTLMDHGLVHMRTIHGNLLLESLLNIATYYLGGLIVGVASPKVRVMEPAVAAVISLFLVMSVGMWMPFSFVSFRLVKTLFMSAVVFALAWTGAVHGEKLTRQL